MIDFIPTDGLSYVDGSDTEPMRVSDVGILPSLVAPHVGIRLALDARPR